MSKIERDFLVPETGIFARYVPEAARFQQHPSVRIYSTEDNYGVGFAQVP
jgi:hypothetical protein